MRKTEENKYEAVNKRIEDSVYENDLLTADVNKITQSR
jgi:hypothetical protein